MRDLSMPAIVVLFSTAAFFAAPASTGTGDSSALTVHEWGTFTSIAGEDGAAVTWLPQAGPTDLPCFVERNRFNGKVDLAGTVRMETPVLYFYAARTMTVNVDVRFRRGVITEWFPPAAAGPENVPVFPGSETAIAWRNVTVSPGLGEDFLVEPRASHYYAARRTDAAPLETGSAREKFLFYRGVGWFDLPIAATVDADGRVKVRPRGQALGDIILFDNHRGRMVYEVRHILDGQVIVDVPVTDEEPARELERLLLANGLYADEASAMIETWRDSWFEEGTRLFYIVPRPAIDAVLPLKIDPAPIAIARVFVGRLELVTPTIRNEVREALLANQQATLRAYGRFLGTIGRRIIAESPPADRMLLERRLQEATAAWLTPHSSCGT